MRWFHSFLFSGMHSQGLCMNVIIELLLWKKIYQIFTSRLKSWTRTGLPLLPCLISLHLRRDSHCCYTIYSWARNDFFKHNFSNVWRSGGTGWMQLSIKHNLRSDHSGHFLFYLEHPQSHFCQSFLGFKTEPGRAVFRSALSSSSVYNGVERLKGLQCLEENENSRYVLFQTRPLRLIVAHIIILRSNWWFTNDFPQSRTVSASNA